MSRTRPQVVSCIFALILGATGSALIPASLVRAQAVDEFLNLDASFVLTQPAAGEANEDGDEFSGAVVSGDFNGDSFGDLVVATPEEALPGGPRSGVVAILLGAEEGLSTGHIISQADADGVNESGDRFGAAVVAGDFNVDGFEDLVVSAPGKNGGAGAVYVFSGSEQGITTGVAITHDAAAGDQFGMALHSGDFNDNGLEDLAVGAPGEDGDKGAVYIFEGAEEVGITTGFVRTQDHVEGEVAAAGDRFGATLAVGDYTGEGFDELTVGAPGQDGDAGAVSTFYGGEDGITTGVPVTQGSGGAGGVSEPGDRFGAALEPGDFDADGFEELIVGAPGEDGSGAIYVFPGAELQQTEGIIGAFVRTQCQAGGTAEAGDQFGAALTHAGFNDDGVPDLAVGAPGKDGNAGAAFVFPGSDSAVGGITTGFALAQSDAGGIDEAGNRFGAAMTAEDYDDDGAADLVVGAPGALVAGRVHARNTPRLESGAAFVFPGVAVSGPSIDQADAGGVNEQGDRFGAAEVTGDFNGDGFEDLVVGTPGKDGMAGVVSIFPGSEDGITEGFSITQSDVDGGVDEGGDEFGAALAAADFDDDGNDDLVVGAPGEDEKRGAVYVFPGAQDVGITTGFLRTQSHAGEIGEGGDRFGAALAAGDFDLDGFADLGVGAPGRDGHSGAVFTFPGSDAGITTGSDPNAVNGLRLRSRFGSALTAGDFDFDGFVDLAVGAPDAAGKSGVVFILLGSAAGVGPGLSITQADAGEENEKMDRFGAALVAGDLNGDEIADLVVGAPGEDDASGRVFIFPGADGDGIGAGVFITQAIAQGEYVAGAGEEPEVDEPGDEFGAALALSDFDPDGFGDLVVGAPGEAPAEGPKSGMIFVFRGSGDCLPGDTVCEQAGIRSVFDPDEDVFDFNFFYTQTGFGGQNEERDRFGAALATGDFDGDEDNLDDLAVGTPGEAPGLDPKSGAVKFIPQSELGI